MGGIMENGRAKTPGVSKRRRRRVLALAGAIILAVLGVFFEKLLLPLVQPSVTAWLSGPSQSPANAVAALPPGSSFQVNFLYRHSTGSPLRPILPGSVLHSGDNYKVVFTPHRNGYVYLFQVDSHEQFFQLFPMTEFRGSRLNNINPVQAGRQYILPAPDKSFRLDNTAGREKILLIFTEHRNEELEHLAQRLLDSRHTHDLSAQTRANSELSSHVIQAFQYRGLDAIETDKILAFEWGPNTVFETIAQQLENFCDNCVNGIEFSHQ